MNNTSSALASTGSASKLRLGDTEHHRQEVLGVRQLVVGEDEGHALAVAEGAGGQRRDLGDQPHDLGHADGGIVDVLGLGVERREPGDRRGQHAHGMRVVVEGIEHPLAEVLVDVGVGRDLVHPGIEFDLRGQLAIDQQVGDLEEGRLLGELLDRIAAVLEHTGVAVDVGDRAVGHGRGGQSLVLEPDTREQLGPLGRFDTAVDDGDLDGFAGSVVGDRDGLSHCCSQLLGCGGVDHGPVVDGRRGTLPRECRRDPSAARSPRVGGAGTWRGAHSGELSWGSCRQTLSLVGQHRERRGDRLARGAGSMTMSIEPRSAAGYGLSSRAS